jgi:hypothetical protein
MVVTDRTPDHGPLPTAAVASPRSRADPGARPASPILEPVLPLLVTAGVLAGLVYALAVTPIGSGDYGQWLMTSRPFLGEAVPAYRDLGEVPQVVPLVLAGIRPTRSSRYTSSPRSSWSGSACPSTFSVRWHWRLAGVGR